MKALRHFKPVFIEAFRLAMAVYPETHVEVDEDRGRIIMHPSAPAVPKQAGKRLLGERAAARRLGETGRHVAINQNAEHRGRAAKRIEAKS